MVSSEEIEELADAVVEAALYAEVNEKLDSEIPAVADSVSEPGAVDRIIGEFAWIPGRFTSFTGIESGGNNIIVSYFNGITSSKFGPTTFEDGVPQGLKHSRFDEFDRVAVIIGDSYGLAFERFQENFLIRAEQMWENQTMLNQCLAATATIAEQIYESTREELLNIGSEAIAAYNAVTLAHAGSAPELPQAVSTSLNLGGIIAGIGSLVTGGAAAVIFGVGSLVAGIISFAFSDSSEEPEAKKAPDDPNAIQGSTVDEVSASLNAKLNKLTDDLRDAEEKYMELLKTLNDSLEKPGVRNTVVAPDMSFPQ